MPVGASLGMITAKEQKTGCTATACTSRGMDWRSPLASFFLSAQLLGVESYEILWDDFLSDYRVTRRDGLWLSDGTDRYPARAREELMAEGEKDKLQPTTQTRS